MAELRFVISGVLVGVLGACSSSQLVVPEVGDGGLTAPADGAGQPGSDGGGGPRFDCSPREIARGGDLRLEQAVLGDDGRVAITWMHSLVTETAYEQRWFVEVIGERGTSDVIARPIPDGWLVPTAEGYAVPTGYPITTIHRLDLDGAESGAPITLPEDWRIDRERLGVRGQTLRGEAWIDEGTAYARPMFELAFDGAEASAEVIGEAAGHTIARRFDRELVRVGEPDDAVVVERALPDGAIAYEVAWPPGIQPLAALFDPDRDRWLVLGEARWYPGGDFGGTRPVIASVPRDGRGVEATFVEAGRPMRTVNGSLAMGPDEALIAADDVHGTAFLVRVDLDTLAASAPFEIEGMWTGRVLWHEASESFALVSQTRPYDETTAVTFRCGL